MSTRLEVPLRNQYTYWYCTTYGQGPHTEADTRTLNMDIKALIIALLPIWILLNVGCATIQSLSEDDQRAYLSALEEMAESDQRYRTALSWGTNDPEELARLEALSDEEHIAEWARRSREGVSLPEDIQAEYIQKQNEVDRENTVRLMRLVEAYGWPTEERLGGECTAPTPILIHMPMDSVAPTMPVLKREVIAGRMDPKQYAAIYDRKLQHDGKIQLYGMCRVFDAKTRSPRPPVISDIEETNAARAEIGLEPLSEYRIAEED